MHIEPNPSSSIPFQVIVPRLQACVCLEHPYSREALTHLLFAVSFHKSTTL